MARLRSNNVFGTTTDAPLTAGATTVNSAGLANLAAVTGSNTAVITLDPNRVNGAPEIVIVTAHTGSATSATITRGAEGTSAREHPAGTFWVHAPTTTDWGTDWAAFTPTITQAVTVAATIVLSRYERRHNTVTWQFDLNVTGSGTSSNEISINLPATPLSISNEVGAGFVFDSSASALYKATIHLASGNRIRFRYTGSTNSGAIGAADMTAGLANGDIIRGTVTYEAS